MQCYPSWSVVLLIAGAPAFLRAQALPTRVSGDADPGRMCRAGEPNRGRWR